MELRQKDPTRDIEHKEINLRSSDTGGLRGSFADSNKSSGGKTSAGEQAKAAEMARLSSDKPTQTFTPEEEGELLSQLSPEEQKQWNSYSEHEKQQVLDNVEKNVEHKMRLRPQTVPLEEPPPDREKAIRNYRMEDESKTNNTGGIRESTRNNGRNGKNGGIRQRGTAIRSSYSESAGDNISSYHEQASYKPDGGIRTAFGRNAAEKANDGSIRSRTSSIREAGRNGDRKGAAKRSSKRKGAFAVGSTGKMRSVNARKRNNTPKMKNATINRKRQSDKSSKNLNNRKRTGDFNKNKDMRPGMTMRQRTNNVRSNPQDNLKYRREQKKAQDEKKVRKNEFLNEFRHELSQDSKKRQNINNEIRSEQITQSEMEDEVRQSVMHTASTPFRIVGGRIVHGITSFIGSAISTLIKYAGGFGGVFAILLVVVIFFIALMPSVVQQNTGGLASGDGEAIVEYAKSWIGITKYVWGAGRNDETDWQDYADCSSFVHGVYSHFGIQLGGDTYAMENNGEVISGGLNNAVPGDIILFYSGSISPNCSSHVGIYAGDGQMVHCSGGPSNYDVAHAGTGVCMKAVADDGRPYEIRRVVTDVSYGGTGVGGYNTDPTNYSQSELELIWAIVAQEDSYSYEGSLAVISTAMNRVDNSYYANKYGTSALAQLTAPDQFCYSPSIGGDWGSRLGGNVSDFVKQAVSDCLNDGIRNHEHTQFRSGYVNGSEQIGTNGNYYFD